MPANQHVFVAVEAAWKRQRPTRRIQSRTVPTISIRTSDDDLAKIDRRAEQLGVTRTAFMLRAVLGRATADERWRHEIEERLTRAEEALFR